MASQPKRYHAIMVSSTFEDLKEHRQEVSSVVISSGFMANDMEHSGAQVENDVIDTSLQMVRDSAAYIAVIGHKYGQTPIDAERNPDGLSITELEFQEARRLELPILLFVMGETHAVIPANFELDPAKREKLALFIEDAKRTKPNAGVQRVYETFANKEDLATKAAIAVGKLARYFDKREHLEELAQASAAAAGAPAIAEEQLHAEFDRIIEVDPDASAEQIFEIIRQNIADRDRQIGELQAFATEDNRIHSLQAAVEEALRANDDAATVAAAADAEAALRERREVDARAAARLASIRATALLRMLDWEGADRAWQEAAKALAPFDPAAAESIVWDAADGLHIHGETFGRAGALSAAIKLWGNLAESARVRGNSFRWAGLQNNLGTALRTQAERTGGEAGVVLLTEAVKAYSAALKVVTIEKEPDMWAMIQNNLSIARTTQGEFTDGPEGLKLFAEAVESHRAILALYDRDTAPVDWALAQNNLGGALATLGDRTGGPEGLELLAEAVEAHLAALTVRTESAMPFDWAASKNNLGNAFVTQANLTQGPEGIKLFGEGVTAYRAALTVYTKEKMPTDWAMAQNNLGAALTDFGYRTDGPKGLRLLNQAATAYRSALSVRTEQAMPAEWAMTTENLANVFAIIAERGTKPRKNFLASEHALLDALRVYTSDHMSYYHNKATNSLARIRAKIAALSD